jgi:hypothetical protein
MLILNDIHIGHHRAGGTTPASRETLRAYLFQSLRDVLEVSGESHLAILGDLFDDFEVPAADWVVTFQILEQHLAAQGTLTLIAGNHDHSPRGGKVSSFEMLCEVLQKAYPTSCRVLGINGIGEIEPNVWAIAHCPNQDLFNMRLEQALKVAPKYLLLHANFHNEFAVESDHSLNVSREVAQSFKDVGTTLVFAHEHQARTALGGSVVVLGNQWPTSVSDCLNNDEKFAHVLTPAGLEKMATWTIRDAVAPFAEVDWRELDDQIGFVRVTGEAKSSEASEVINAIAKFRVKSEAFVITNSVQIDGIAETASLPVNFDAVKKFDVTDFIKKNLTDEEYAVVENLITEGA